MMWASLCALLGMLCLIYIARKMGESDATATHEEKINDAVQKALMARDRLHADADFAKRVRERFKR